VDPAPEEEAQAQAARPGAGARLSRSLLAACALYALFVAGWSAARAAAGRPPAELCGLAARALAGVQALQALLAGAVLLIGTPAVGDPVTVMGYAVASAVLIPAAFAFGDEEDGWDGAILTIACVALAVADWRLTILWAS
jgi:hypothetical protein